MMFVLRNTRFGFRTDVMNFLLVEGVHSVAQSQLEQAGLKVDQMKSALGHEELLQKKGYVGLGIRSRTRISKKILETHRSHLRVIGTFCIGTDQVDLTTACLLGIPVFNAPYGNTRSVAELVISHIISLSRQTYVFDRLMHNRKWHKTTSGSREIRGKTLGIIGYGHIGTQTGILAEAMGMQVRYFDIVETLPIGNAQPVKTLKKLLSISDFVTLHVPETPLTKNMIAYEQIKQMRKGGFLINTSRGSVLNFKDATRALKEKHLSGLALDVYPVEPEQKQADFSCELQGMENVILTPHIAGSTEEAQENIARQVASTLKKYLFQGITEGAVNFPVLNPPELNSSDHSQRLINIHKNVPGVLADINGLVSRLKINIKSQHLATNAQIGYLIMDVEQEHISNLCREVDALKTSLRTYILPRSV